MPDSGQPSRRQVRPTTVIVATGSRHKLCEVQEVLRDPDLIVVGLDYLADADFHLPPENGPAMSDNASLKARAGCLASSLITLADDSGLEVDFLDGQPGVHSHRFLGEHATDEDRYREILRLLEGVPEKLRAARFRCAAAVAFPGPAGRVEVETVDATCEGRIAHTARGENGFGYDPIFLLPDLQRTMAELTTEEKNQLSHRGKAFLQVKDLLRLRLAACS